VTGNALAFAIYLSAAYNPRLSSGRDRKVHARMDPNLDASCKLSPRLKRYFAVLVISSLLFFHSLSLAKIVANEPFLLPTILRGRSQVPQRQLCT